MLLGDGMIEYRSEERWCVLDIFEFMGEAGQGNVRDIILRQLGPEMFDIIVFAIASDEPGAKRFGESFEIFAGILFIIIFSSHISLSKNRAGPA
ncbi:hypothetical protein [Salibaculum griseiflavum]|uniref:Uncharacterized protein n=1 Tax=Salibaculum griseiflavum TaxID=1914409 RepID=A0A2V1P542_9RHOB|nr:hypothetical protein [Salibaculum griseiflavum]PWG17545.1 hypothetical protein DFK10_04770 [Salibaculum griseiflavum]